MKQDIIVKFLDSWITTENTINTTEQIKEWVELLNETTYVNINDCSINDSDFWFYDEYSSAVLNRKSSFFSVKGIRMFKNGHFVSEQPIIIQPEIGYLGIICKEIDGVLYFLMQAKIEPGNINCVQISPTIQATKSNFNRVHGGKLPDYFEYFENASKYKIVYDQIQSEQASRFYKKRNRNIIILIEEEIEVKNNFKWMTLGQIKQLMKIDNLVNMDTRTVISGIPFWNDCEDLFEQYKEKVNDVALLKSIYNKNDSQEKITEIYHYINSYKMFNSVERQMVPLNQLVDWEISDYGIQCNKEANFEVRYYDIEINGREVHKWIQPLFKAKGSALFGLITRVNDKGIREFLVSTAPEIGSFDVMELGPTVYLEANELAMKQNEVVSLFMDLIENKENVLIDVILSEEGGRFYHEENRNVVVNIPNDMDIKADGYFWVDLKTLYRLTQINNCLNIQLRNLMSLLEV